MKKWLFIIVIVLTASSTSMSGECKEHVVLYSAEYLAKEYGKSEMWVLSNVKINLWEKPTPQGKGRVVGKMLPGSHALILEKGSEDYKVKSPLDGYIGWVNKIQVSKIVKQDTETRKPCE